MEDAFGHRLVDGARRALQTLGRLGGVPRVDGLADALHERADARADRLVAHLSFDALAMALLRRGVLGHRGRLDTSNPSARQSSRPPAVVGRLRWARVEQA